jgi:hypothetical protein
MTHTINSRFNGLDFRLRAYNFNTFVYGQAGTRFHWKHRRSTIERHGTEVRMMSRFYIKNKFDPLYPPLLNIDWRSASSRNEKWTITRLFQVLVWAGVKRADYISDLPPGLDPTKFWPSGVVTVAEIKVGNLTEKHIVARGDVPENWRDAEIDRRIWFAIDRP